MGRVLQNLVGNALKFTPEGGAITIAARQEGNKVLATVSDTGPGIAPEIRGRLFQKFVTGQM
jgi:signal transduction histidine kinase